jgi:elongation factor Ts
MDISATDVKKLRDMTGAGMMDCKEALASTSGDFESAVDFLRKKGMASAQKRLDRAANEGAVVAYIHPGSRLGVMVEVNCETDFVAKTDAFQAFAKDIAMHIAASNPTAVSREEIDPKLIERETEIYRSQVEDGKKPAAVIEKIIQGKLDKFYQDNVLTEQSYVKDSTKTIKDYVLEISGKLGERIAIRRFVRFQLGESPSC